MLMWSVTQLSRRYVDSGADGANGPGGAIDKGDEKVFVNGEHLRDNNE